MSRNLFRTTTLVSAFLAISPFLTCISFAAQPATYKDQPANILSVIERGIYWFERYRYDLATQAFNKVLLVQPNQPEALKWKGLIDLNSGNSSSAQIWLEQLFSTSGPNHPQAIELKQSIDIATHRRQKVAEIEFLANRGSPPEQWLPDLKGLFSKPPLGEAAILYYELFAQQGEAAKEFARRNVRELISQFPRDRRYLKLLTDLGGVSNPTAPDPCSHPRSKVAMRCPG